VVVEKHTEYQVNRQNTDRVVLQQAEEENCLIAKIKERQKTWVGHVLRSGSLLQRVVEGSIQGIPTLKRKKKNWNAVWIDRKRKLRKPQKKSTR